MSRPLFSARILDRYAAHYNRHRPHRARNLRPTSTGETTPAAITDGAGSWED